MSPDKNELFRFYEKMAHLDETEMIIMCKNQMGNYIIQIILKNAPHTLAMITTDDWNYSYSRKDAAFPLEYINENKYWPTVRRVNDAFGDRNLICSCNPIEDYM